MVGWKSQSPCRARKKTQPPSVKDFAAHATHSRPTVNSQIARFVMECLANCMSLSQTTHRSSSTFFVGFKRSNRADISRADQQISPIEDSLNHFVLVILWNGTDLESFADRSALREPRQHHRGGSAFDLTVIISADEFKDNGSDLVHYLCAATAANERLPVPRPAFGLLMSRYELVNPDFPAVLATANRHRGKPCRSARSAAYVQTQSGLTALAQKKENPSGTEHGAEGLSKPDDLPLLRRRSPAVVSSTKDSVTPQPLFGA
jgi:hypothetical protein